MSLPEATRIDDYEIVRLLGKGGMGEVYLARDVRLGREAAVKVLPADSLAQPDRRKRFEREARAASRLTHANAAVVYGFGTWSGGAYIAMEYVPGDTLVERLAQGCCPAAEVAQIGVQVAEVLQAAHEKGIIHRDLKPGNIMLNRQNQVKLLDFGLAAIQQDPAEGAAGETVSMLTEAGIVVGTVAYMSPEQVLGRPLDARSDIFSLGGVLYEIATAHRPFAGSNKTEVISKILTGAPDPVSRWNYDVPAELERIIRKCLEKNADDRYQSAREVAIDLRNWKRDRDTSVLTASSIARPPLVTRRTAVFGGASVATLGAAGFFGYRWTQADASRSIAILPFANEGQPENDYLTDGFTESVINLAATYSGLSVIARSAVYRFKRAEDPIGIGQKLNVGAVLVGRLNPSKDVVGVVAELVDVATARQIWNQRLETPLVGLQSLPSKLVDEILRALGMRKSKSGAKPNAHPVENEAYLLYLKGRYAWNKRVPDAYNKAVDYFKKAIDIDPTFALAYAGLADVYSRQSGVLAPKDVCPRAKAAAERAIELDSSLAEAHAALAYVQLHYDWDWTAAEAQCQQAVRLNASYPSAHSYYARLLTARKRFPEAIQEQKKAEALDPLAPALASALASTYYFARQYEEAERQFRRVLAAEKQYVQASAMLGVVQIARKNYNGAIETLEGCVKAMGDDDFGILADLGLAYALSGNHTKARDCIARIDKIAERDYVMPTSRAFPYIGLGEYDRAVPFLEAAMEERVWPVIYFGVEPKLDPLRTNPRFQKILSRLG